MEFAYLIIMFAFAIMFSNVFNRIVPVIPLPLVQIIFGVVIGLTKMGQEINFEPEIFLLMIIAPLLFREGERADVPSLLKNFSVILFLAFAGVIITLLSVGWAIHWMIPSLPIAACFALGAALGPTDAVAVGSLSRKIKIPEKAMHILEGEALINDASGVTAFQFALAALLTGSFSVLSAGGSLLFSSIGGALVGFFLVLLKRQLVQLLEKAAARDVSGYLLLELLLPFLAYVIGEVFHVSGIIAAVVAGVMQAANFKKVSLFEAELFSVSETTWSTITFTLNALVFLFLGIELSLVFSPIWNSTTYSNWFLLCVVSGISLTLFIARFCSISLIYAVKNGLHTVRSSLKEILILTFGGVKGTISLATVFILPSTVRGESFQERPLLLFITACVILVTLLIGMLVLPLLTDSEDEMTVDVVKIELLNDVMQKLEQINEQNHQVEMNVVIETYRDRIKELLAQQLPESQREEMQELRALIVAIEHEGLEEAFRRKEISIDGYRFYSRLISRMERSITRQLLSIIGFWVLLFHQLVAIFFHPTLSFSNRKAWTAKLKQQELAQMSTLFLRNTEIILNSLDNLESVYDAELLAGLKDERIDLAQKVQEGRFLETFIVRSDEQFIHDLLIGYQEERKLIDAYEKAGKISFDQANDYRKSVNLLEAYAIDEATNNLPLRKFQTVTEKEAG